MKIADNYNKYIIIFEMVSIAIFVLLSFRTVDLSSQRYQDQKNRFDMIEKADELRHSSDDLTHFARTYIVTGDKEFKERYYKTLHIRKGAVGRPFHYGGVYWDLDSNTREKKHPIGDSISLKKLISNLPYTKEELSLLELAEKNSNELAYVEIEAFNAIEDEVLGSYVSRQNYAIKLLYSPFYYEAKNSIMKPIDAFMTSVNKRTYDNIKRANKKITFYHKMMIFSVVLFVIGNMFIYLVLNKYKKLLILKNRQLENQSRLAQMGEMLSMIAHQWRQPLGAISSTSIDLKMKIELEAFDLDDEKSRKECSDYFVDELTNIEKFTQNLTTTIDDFRNFYKRDKTKKRLCINEPIDKALSIVSKSFKTDNIKINKRYKTTKKLELLDSEMMQVILNILKNTQDNFKEKNSSNAFINIVTKDTLNGVIIKISDNGGGIDKDIINNIFDPYFTTKDEKNGTGLGLYMSKTIIEEHHNGSLKVANTKSGVCFSVELPIENLS